MTTTTSTTFMDPQIWTGKIFNGDWITPTGGEYPVVESATGAQLGVVGQANIEDVRQAADRAAEAQQAWAQAPFDQRARVLRRAGQIWEEQADDIREWIIRESGSTVPKAGFELHVAASDPLHPLRGTCPGPGQRCSAQARSPHRCVWWCRPGPHLPGGRAASRPVPRATRWRGCRRSRGHQSPRAGDQLHRLDRCRTSRGRTGGQASQASASRTGGQQCPDRVGRRRPGAGGAGGSLGLVLPSRPDLHGHWPSPRP